MTNDPYTLPLYLWEWDEWPKKKYAEYELDEELETENTNDNEPTNEND